MQEQLSKGLQPVGETHFGAWEKREEEGVEERNHHKWTTQSPSSQSVQWMPSILGNTGLIMFAKCNFT